MLDLLPGLFSERATKGELPDSAKRASATIYLSLCFQFSTLTVDFAVVAATVNENAGPIDSPVRNGVAVDLKVVTPLREDDAWVPKRPSSQSSARSKKTFGTTLCHRGEEEIEVNCKLALFQTPYLPDARQRVWRKSHVLCIA